MKKFSKFLSVLLCAAMVIGMMPMVAFAEESEETTYTYSLVTSVDQLDPEKSYMIAASMNGADYYAMSTSVASGMAQGEKITVSSGTVAAGDLTVTSSALLSEWTITLGSATTLNQWYVTLSADGQYLELPDASESNLDTQSAAGLGWTIGYSNVKNTFYIQSVDTSEYPGEEGLHRYLALTTTGDNTFKAYAFADSGRTVDLLILQRNEENTESMATVNTYKQVLLEQITNDHNQEYVIVVKYGDAYKVLGTSVNESNKVESDDITVSGQFITGSSLPVWTVNRVGDTISLYNGEQYLSYDSGANVKLSDTEAFFAIDAYEVPIVVDGVDTGETEEKYLHVKLYDDTTDGAEDRYLLYRESNESFVAGMKYYLEKDSEEGYYCQILFFQLHTHNYVDQDVEDRALVPGATCLTPHKWYFPECWCNEHSPYTTPWESTLPGPHTYGVTFTWDADYNATYYADCELTTEENHDASGTAVVTHADGCYTSSVTLEDVTYTDTISEDYFVAKIGSVGYTSLEAALEAAEEDDTIVLLEDVTVDENLFIRENVIIDLNGNTLTADAAIVVSSDTTLKLTDTSDDAGELIVNDQLIVKGTLDAGDITVTTGSSGTITIYEDGEAKLSGWTEDDLNNGTVFDSSLDGAHVTLEDEDEDGNRYVLVDGVWVLENAVAAIGDKTYESLQDAIDDATDGDTIKLLQNTTEDVTVDKEITLDLNGNTVTGDITVGGDLTITDSGVDGAIDGTVTNTGTVTVTDGTLEAITNSGALSIDGGNVTGTIINNNGTIGITSGNFGEKPEDDWIVKGSNILKQDDSTYPYLVKQLIIKYVNMVMGNELSMKFYVAQEDVTALEGYESFYAEIIKKYADGREDLVEQINFVDWKQYTYNGEALWYVRFDGIAAKEMADEISVIIYSEDGTQLSVEKITSLKDYAEGALKQYANDSYARTMMVDMLNYGAAAQDYFNYNENNFANNNLTEVQKTYATDSTECTGDLVKGDNFAGVTLTYANKIRLTLYFKNLTEDMYAQVTYTDHYRVPQSVRIEGTNFYWTSSGLAGVDIDTLVVADYDQLVTCTVYDENNEAVASAACSMAIYSKLLKEQESEEAQNLSEAMKFAASAYAYLHQDDPTEYTTEELQDALIATAWAYFLKEDKIQYCSQELTDGLSKYFGGTYRLTEDASPEYGTSDTTIYSVCSDFVYKVYYEALGVRLFGADTYLGAATEDFWMKSANQYETLFRWVNDNYAGETYGASSDVDAARTFMENWATNLEPGDVITMTGHAFLYVGNGYVMDCWGGKYDESTGVDVFEYDGAVCTLHTVEDLFIDGDDLVTNKGYVIADDVLKTDENGDTVVEKDYKNWLVVFRPLAGTYCITSEDVTITTADSRQQFPAMEIDRTVDITPYGTVSQGENLTYSIVISNKTTDAAWLKYYGTTSGEDYQDLVVTETIPEGTELVEGSITGGGVYADGVITWVVDIKAGESAELSYQVKVTASIGSTITNDGGYVANIPSNSISNTVGGVKLSDAAQDKLADFAETDKSEWFTKYNISCQAPDMAFANRVYAAVMGLDLDLPDVQALMDALFTYEEITNESANEDRYPGSQTASLFTLKDTVEQYQTIRDMMVAGYYGGQKLYSARGLTMNEFGTEYLEPGDILVYADMDGETVVGTRVMIYAEKADGTKVLLSMISEGVTSVFESSTGTNADQVFAKLWNALTEDIFFVLRPSQVYKNVNTLVYDTAEEPEYDTANEPNDNVKEGLEIGDGLSAELEDSYATALANLKKRYLSRADTSSNMKKSAYETAWTLTQADDGSFRLASSYSTDGDRYLMYSTTNNGFKAYADAAENKLPALRLFKGSGSTYEEVKDISKIDDNNYVIVVDVDGVYYAMSTTVDAGVYQPVKVTISDDGKIVTDEEIVWSFDVTAGDTLSVTVAAGWSQRNTAFVEEVYDAIGIDLTTATKSATVADMLKGAVYFDSVGESSNYNYELLAFCSEAYERLYTMAVPELRGGPDMVGYTDNYISLADLKPGDVLNLVNRVNSCYWVCVYLGEGNFLVSQYDGGAYQTYALYSFADDDAFDTFLTTCDKNTAIAWEAYYVLRPSWGFEDINDYAYTEDANTMDYIGTLEGFAQVTSLDEITDGYYVIAVQVDGKYYFMSHTHATSGGEIIQLNGASAAVSDGVITADGLKYWAIDVDQSANAFRKVTVFNQNGSVYVREAGATSIGVGDTEEQWYLTYEDGSFRLQSTTDQDRYLMYNTTYNCFKAYDADNDTRYPELYLFKWVGEDQDITISNDSFLTTAEQDTLADLKDAYLTSESDRTTDQAALVSIAEANYNHISFANNIYENVVGKKIATYTTSQTTATMVDGLFEQDLTDGIFSLDSTCQEDYAALLVEELVGGSAVDYANAVGINDLQVGDILMQYNWTANLSYYSCSVYLGDGYFLTRIYVNNNGTKTGTTVLKDFSKDDGMAFHAFLTQLPDSSTEYQLFWVLRPDIAEVESGDYVIVGYNKNDSQYLAMGTSASTTAPATTVTGVDDTAIAAMDSWYITATETDPNTWTVTLHNSDGKYLSRQASSSNLELSDTAVEWTLTYEGGYYQLSNENGDIRYLCTNGSNGSYTFKAYEAENASSGRFPQLQLV